MEQMTSRSRSCGLRLMIHVALRPRAPFANNPATDVWRVAVHALAPRQVAVGSRSMILCLVRPMAAIAKAAFSVLCVCLAVSVVAGAETPERFVGSFAGASLRADPFGRSFVVCLEVSERAGTYSLAAVMNDTNREPGMDHTSNTHWRWTGSGAIRGSALEFTFSSADTPLEKGSLRRTRAGLLLKLGRIQYRMKRASEPCQSDDPPN